MKLIPFETEELLDASDALKASAYSENVINSNLSRFTNKYNIGGIWHMEYSEEYSSYYTETEISNIVIVPNPVADPGI